jgi:hypothetical protein
MASISEQLISVYVFVDDYLKAHPGLAHWRHSPNDAPAFSDAEVITIGLMQSCLGVATLKRAYEVVASEYRDCFPHLSSYAQWLSRLHTLTPIIGELALAALQRKPLSGRLYLVDAKPIPVCRPIRHARVRLLREDGAYFGKSSTGWYFGFKLHVLTHATGCILAAILTPGNWRERDAAVALGASVLGGVALADKGYCGPVQEEMAQETQILLITPKDAEENPSARALISSVRERVETTFSQLWNRFVDRVLSRSWNGLWNTIKLKMLHCNLCYAGILPA